MPPKKLERKLWATTRRRGYEPKRAKAYVYGGLRDTGWKPRVKKKGRKK